MNWTRYKLLIISGGMTLIVSGGLIFWITSTRNKNLEVDNQIQTLNSRQSGLFAKKPFPSQKNFEQLEAEQAKVEVQRDELKKQILEGQLKVVEVSQNRFGDYIRYELVPNLRNKAETSTKGGEHGVILSDPDFGLTDYLSGVLPETSKIPGLLLELQTMEHLSLLLFDAGISELNLVAKAEKGNTGKRPVRAVSLTDLAGIPSQTSGSGRASGEEDTRSELLKQKERLFNWQDYRLEFRVYEDFLWQLLNRMVADPNQLVITEMYITNSNDMLWPKYLEPVMGGRRRMPARPRAPAREPGNDLTMLLQGIGGVENTGTGPEPVVQIAGLAERRENVVGQDLLNVVMVVRVYRLAEETLENEEGR